MSSLCMKMIGHQPKAAQPSTVPGPWRDQTLQSLLAADRPRENVPTPWFLQPGEAAKVEMEQDIDGYLKEIPEVVSRVD